MRTLGGQLSTLSTGLGTLLPVDIRHLTMHHGLTNRQAKIAGAGNLRRLETELCHDLVEPKTKFLNFERRKITILGSFLLIIMKLDAILMVLATFFQKSGSETRVQILKSSAENP